MSIHSSLKGVDTLTGERSVLTRFERVLKLSKDGKLDPESESAYGLPKVRTKFKVPKVKKEEKPAAEGEAAEGEGEAASAEGAIRGAAMKPRAWTPAPFSSAFRQRTASTAQRRCPPSTNRRPSPTCRRTSKSKSLA